MSPYERNILEKGVKQQTKKTTKVSVISPTKELNCLSSYAVFEHVMKQSAPLQVPEAKKVNVINGKREHYSS